MNAFMDTSVLLRWLLREPAALSPWGPWGAVYCSALLEVEARRTLDRRRLEGRLADVEHVALLEKLGTFLAAAHVAPVTEAILDRAGQAFPTTVGTLDALHLASALEIRDKVDAKFELLTHDSQLALAARAMGLSVRDR